MNIKQYAAFYTLNLLTIKEFVSFAELLMMEGYSSKRLSMVAAEDIDESHPFNRSEVRKKMDRVLYELKIILPEQFEAMQVVICYWCREIVDRQKKPLCGIILIRDLVDTFLPNMEWPTYIELTDTSSLYFDYSLYDDYLSGDIVPENGYEIEIQKDQSLSIADAAIIMHCKEYLRKYQAV